MIGLQLGPILETLNGAELRRQLLAALVILAVVIVVRLLWALMYVLLKAIGHRSSDPQASSPDMSSSAAKSGLVIGWSGMRGIVTLATALALPDGFPYRDFIQLTAYAVVLGTLVIQGLTLRPMLLWLNLPSDHTVETETNLAWSAALKAGMRTLEHHAVPAAQRLREEYRAALSITRSGGDLSDSPDNL
ncbi:cation:proton antiporter [Deinococcus altitudinis]|uniref:cation:proton antiporter domain-containing protein n=1 Tax=Deinococcus altitudinis TaxID=468914 RepID=UPI003892954A